MSIWLSERLSDIAGSHRLQLGVTAVASACLAASAVIGLQEARRWYEQHELKDSIPSLQQPHDVKQVCRLAAIAVLTLTKDVSDQRVWRRRAGAD